MKKKSKKKKGVLKILIPIISFFILVAVIILVVFLTHHKKDSCTPNCKNKNCGSDGCGGVCPPGCSQGQSCTFKGQCMDTDCQAKGADYCKNTFGPNFKCINGKCSCSPNCQGKDCGDDGCNGVCPNKCSPGESCINGKCKKPSPPPPPPKPAPPRPHGESIKDAYKNLQKTVGKLRLGYWGACPPTGCGGGGGQPWNQDFQSLNSNWNIVVLSFLVFDDVSKGTIKLDLTNSISLDTLQDQIEARREKGGFVLASLGGGICNNCTIPENVDPDTWAANMTDSWSEIATKYHLDGIDIDMETNFSSSSSMEYYKKFLSAVSKNGYLVSCAPILDGNLIGNVNASWANDYQKYICDVSTGPIFSQPQRTYNFLLEKDFINNLDIVFLQIYNNAITAGQFENTVKMWLLNFALWCQTKDIGTDCNSVPPSDYSKIVDPQQTQTCVNSTNPIQLTPAEIASKFFMGFCGSDCDPRFQYNPEDIKKLLPFFQGVGIWALDEYYDKTQTPEDFVDNIFNS